MRQDASRNRAAILAAAREILSGFDDLKLSMVAQRAGIGQATLYRHFPTQDALLAAVYEAEIGELVIAADQLVREKPPLEALRSWFARLAEYVRVKRGILKVVETFVWEDMSASTMGKLGSALGTLLSAGASLEEFRHDIDPRDVILLSWFMSHVTAEEWDARVPRLLDVLVAGLQTKPGE
ncbi:TetR/AcrR family transcriptional regulator [Glaciibacter flavus]|uniref:TetR/AcrR family transcriptional regulator n=1 Tax=Orlajensenia flava TaxID=2565934 RepID=UPI001F3D2F93|nr:TetR/AcrR family transcriptional regulator [Glaciibacter flavus]